VKIKAILLLVLCLVVQNAFAAKKKPKTCGAKSFETCPSKGCGGDPLLNQRKNTKVQPAASDIEKVTRTRFTKLKFPASWKSGTSRNLLKDWGEETPVEYQAYLIKITHYTSGMESCNCNLKKEENNDFHLVLVDKRGTPEETSITAEISPRIRPAGWTFKKLNDLSKKKTYIKVTGFLMLDTQHISKPIKRLTNWEIHPVTSLQVCTVSVTGCKEGNGWIDLADIPEP
jgi:hypothetical protein